MKRIGRRGVMLLILGLAYILLGIGQIVNPAEYRSGVFHTTVFPWWAPILLWCVPGAVGAFFAFRKQDRIGWTVMYLPPLIRVASYALGIVHWIVPGGLIGYGVGWYAMLIYALFMAVVLVCSGWREPNADPAPLGPEEGWGRARS